MQVYYVHMDSLLAGDVGDLREGQLQQHLLLVVHHVDAGPVDGDDDVVLGQVRPGVAEGLVEAGEEQGPLVLGVAHHVLLHLQHVHAVLHVVALQQQEREEENTKVRKIGLRPTLCWNGGAQSDINFASTTATRCIVEHNSVHNSVYYVLDMCQIPRQVITWPSSMLGQRKILGCGILGVGYPTGFNL